MARKIIFEDIYTQGNPYQRDMKPQYAKGSVVSIHDLINQKKDYDMNMQDTYLPYPCDSIIQKMTMMREDVYVLGGLLTQLMNNKSTDVSEKNRKKLEDELKNIKNSLKNIADTIDNII